MRADAQLNHERLLAAAAATFARDGADASLKDIAKEAGVGIGTLYRRFPTREMLVEATYRNETSRLGEAAPELLEKLDPMPALRTWMDQFVAYIATKHGMAESLKAVLDDDRRLESRQLLADALGVLLRAGIEAGALRDDVPAEDVLMGLGGITLIADGDRALAGRLSELLVAGLRN
ncbi:helix-turn-helix transcriptional regulator [Kribbella qitaiheensis]|uniref:Helix-turn-helix transcriptional regulator n=1 Tax=Kribbella qitaiheensis TaxID=1544730 RepID=A0A7G6X463_9ACTN|nr:TetR/AcrR family transcriptional regulator [Kribbella qitaiheensis]QNE21028.1 helix-turn-helix transcriptional regulator [Kribbella qitaiheensis]